MLYISSRVFSPIYTLEQTQNTRLFQATFLPIFLTKLIPLFILLNVLSKITQYIE